MKSIIRDLMGGKLTEERALNQDSSGLNHISDILLPFGVAGSGAGGGVPWQLSSRESTCTAGDAGDVGSIPGLGRPPGGEHGHPLQCSCLENPWMEKPGGLQSMGSQGRT